MVGADIQICSLLASLLLSTPLVDKPDLTDTDMDEFITAMTTFSACDQLLRIIPNTHVKSLCLQYKVVVEAMDDVLSPR